MNRAAAGQGVLYRALRQMREDLWLTGVAISTLCVALAIVGAYLTLSLNLDRAGRSLTTGPVVMVVLDDQASPEQGKALASELATWPQVAGARYVGQDEALERFRGQLGPHAGLLEGLEGNPLPNAVELELAPDPAAAEQLIPRLNRLVLVTEVITSRPWLHRLEQALGVLGRLSAVVGGLLFLAVVLLTTNTMRLAVYVRRHELEVMDLLGASPAYVRAPFLLEGVIQGLAAAGLASLLLWGLLALLRTPTSLPLGIELSALFSLPPLVVPLLLAVGAAAGVLGALLGVSRVLSPEVHV